MIFRLHHIILVCIVALAPVTSQAQPIIVDNVDAGFSTNIPWSIGTFASDRYGADYAFANNISDSAAAPTYVATWVAPITQAGYYEVAEFHSQGSNRSPNAPFTIISDAGDQIVRVNQEINGGQFNTLTIVHYDAGDTAEVRLGNNADNNVVIADAIRLTPTTEAAHNEYRFFWVSRYQWPSSNESTAKFNIRDVFETAASYNFNGVFFQIRGQMDTHYPSPYEPWSNVYGWTDPGWDPLAYALDHAHANGIELHAYFNTHTMISPVPPANTTPQHIYNLHGPGAPAGADRWDAFDAFGNPIGGDGYVWLSPGVPQASYHTRRELMYLVDNYDIDGAHFDRIRTSQPDASYDPISISRFNGDGNPDGLSFKDFMREQILRDLRKIYGAVQYANIQRVNEGRPDVKISSAPIGISRRGSDTHYQGTGTSAWFMLNQDAWAWLKAHVMDFVVPQIYWEIDSVHPHEKLLADWMENAGGRWIVPGSRTAKTSAGDGPKPLSGLIGEWQESVDQGAAGKCYWQWESLSDVPPGETQSYYEALKAGPYKYNVLPPQMPWKTNPTTGYITGYVLDEAGAPVVDAWVKLDGDDYTYLTAWDGFFSIVDVPPGTSHSLSVTKIGSGSGASDNIAIAAGGVSLDTINLNSHRGFADFTRTRCRHDSPVSLRLYDQDLIAAPTAAVYVYGPADPIGETVVLTAEGGGEFSGTLDMDISVYAPGDQKLRAMPGTEITVQYIDADSGEGTNVVVESHAEVIWPEDIIVESRTPGGFKTSVEIYEEFASSGSFSGTPLIGPNKEVVKSHAPNLYGLGDRALDGQGGFEFSPPVESSGLYDVYVTIPGADQSTDFVAPNTLVQITSSAPPPAVTPDMNTTIDLSSGNPNVAGQWMKIFSDVPFDRGNAAHILFSTSNPNAGPSQQFCADAIKLVYRSPLGVNAAVEDWELF